MFFYTSLFIASVITALLVIYLYNALASVGKALYRGLLPSSKDNVTGHVSRTRYYSTRNDTPSPWGWKGNGNQIREHGHKAATANGNSGLDAFIDNHGKRSSSSGWLHREEKTEFAGSSYKVSRKTGSKGKPWGW